jgi:hypothetical protein
VHSITAPDPSLRCWLLNQRNPRFHGAPYHDPGSLNIEAATIPRSACQPKIENDPADISSAQWAPNLPDLWLVEYDRVHISMTAGGSLRGHCLSREYFLGASIVMENLNKLAVASQPARGLQSFQSVRSFQILRRHDGARLRAFFLSFDFDQRRAYFGGDVSNQSVCEYCDAIDWDHTTVIARGGPSRLEAVAILKSLPPNHTAADLSIACPQPCCHESFMPELLDLAIDVATLRYRRISWSVQIVPNGTRA